MASLAKLEEQLARVRASKSTAVRTAKKGAERLIRTSTNGATGYVVGKSEADGKVLLPAVGGLDYRLVWGAVGHAAAMVVPGKAGDVVANVADSLITIFGYRAGLAGAGGIAGDDLTREGDSRRGIDDDTEIVDV